MSSLPPPPGDLPPVQPPADQPVPPPPSAPVPPPPPLVVPIAAPPVAAPPPVAMPSSVRISIEPPPKRRRTGLWLGLLGLVAVGAGAVALVAASDDDTTVTVAPTTTLDAGAAGEVWDDIVGSVEFDAGDYGSGGEMKACPFGSFDEWTKGAPESLQDALDDVSDAEEFFEVYLSSDEEDQKIVQCSYYDERTETQAAIGITHRLDMDYRQEIVTLLPSFELTFDPDQQFAGGTLVSYCGKGMGDAEGTSFCQADWYDGDVVIAVYVNDEEATADEHVEWMQASLADWLQALENVDVDDLDVTTVTY